MADWTHVQGAADLNTANSSITISAVGNGNIVLGGCVIDTGKSITITDNTGANTYDVFPSDDDGTLAAFIFKPRAPITNGPTSITFNFTPAGAPGNFEKVVDEFALPTSKSAVSFDGGQVVMTNSGTFTGLAATDSPAFQNLQSDALIYGFGVSNGSITGGASFNVGATGTAGAVTLISQWKIQSTPVTTNKLSFATQAGTLWGAVMAIAPVAATSWIPIQSARQFPPGASAATFSVSFSKATTKGNMLVGEFFPNSGSFAELQTFTDDASNNYLPNCLTPQPSGRSIFWSGGLLTNTPKTLSGTLSPSDAIGLFVTEFMPPPGTVSVAIDGGGLVDVSSGAPGAGSVSTPNITTTKIGDLVYSSVEPAGVRGCVPLNGITCTNGAGFSLANGYIIQPTAGAIAATWDVNGGANLTMFELAISAKIAAGGQQQLHLGLGIPI